MWRLTNLKERKIKQFKELFRGQTEQTNIYFKLTKSSTELSSVEMSLDEESFSQL